MYPSSVRTIFAHALVAFALAIAPSARAAESKDTCFDSYEQAQRLRKSGDLRGARDKLAVCKADACPDFVRKDCKQWAGEVDAALPTIVVRAKDASGKPIDDARVYVDGEKVADRVDGKPIAVNPGEHTVRVEAGDRKSEQKITAKEKDRDVPVDVAIEAEKKRDDTPPPPPPPAPESHGLPVATYVLGGVAIAGVGAFVAFGLSGKSDESCKPTCTRSQVDTLRRAYLLADVSLLVSLAAGGGALYFALSSKHGAKSDAPAASQARVVVRALPIVGGGFVSAGVIY
jgi:hypothetical protein